MLTSSRNARSVLPALFQQRKPQVALHVQLVSMQMPLICQPAGHAPKASIVRKMAQQLVRTARLERISIKQQCRLVSNAPLVNSILGRVRTAVRTVKRVALRLLWPALLATNVFQESIKSRRVRQSASSALLVDTARTQHQQNVQNVPEDFTTLHMVKRNARGAISEPTLMCLRRQLAKFALMR